MSAGAPRCKVGDLVVYVGRETDLLGRTTTVTQRKDYQGAVAWRVDPPLRGGRFTGRAFTSGNWFFDTNLQPLRDQDGEDEMLRIAGRPVADAQHA